MAVVCLLAACGSGDGTVDGDASTADASSDGQGPGPGGDASAADGSSTARDASAGSDAATDATIDAGRNDAGDASIDATSDAGTSNDGSANDGASTGDGSGNDGATTNDGAAGEAGSDAGTTSDGATDAGDGSDAGSANDGGNADDGGASQDSGSGPGEFPTFRLDTTDTDSVNAGSATTIAITGSGWSPQAAVVFRGQVFAIARAGGAISEGSVTFPGSATLGAGGDFAITIRNVPGDPASESNPAYLRVYPAAGDGGTPPSVVELWPDWGVAGETIAIDGYDFSDPATIEDSAGHAVALTGDRYDRTFVVPANWVSGPLTIRTPRGSWVWPRFHVGANLLLHANASATSVYSSGYAASNVTDGDVTTRWSGESGSCTVPVCAFDGPSVTAFLPTPTTVSKVGVRGNPYGTPGFAVTVATIEVLGPNGLLLASKVTSLPSRERHVDVNFTPVPNARSVRVRVQGATSSDPTLAEIEAF
ncbi:MAG: hypothetical protein U0169_05140 [Polyangiaceae bacterium]